MYESFKAFIRAIIKKWVWLVTGIIGGGVFIMNLLGINPSISRPIGIAILIVCFLIACFLTYNDLYTVATSKDKKTTIVKRPRLSLYHHFTLNDIEQQMEKVHGHSDHNGLESDLHDGILTSDLLGRNCTRCGKPRNQKGD